MRQNVNIRLALPFASSDKCINSLKREWVKWIALPLIACFVAMRLFPRKDMVQQFRKGNPNLQQFPWIFHRRQIKLLNESETYGKLGQWYDSAYLTCILLMYSSPLLECANLKKLGILHFDQSVGPEMKCIQVMDVQCAQKTLAWWSAPLDPLDQNRVSRNLSISF